MLVYLILKQRHVPLWNNLTDLTYLQAWKLWKEGTPLDFLDPTLDRTNSENEVRRCIQIGLLCVQEDPEKRPTMNTIVLMFSSYSITLPLPQQPAFCNRSTTETDDIPSTGHNFDQSASNELPLSINEASITEFYPR